MNKTFFLFAFILVLSIVSVRADTINLNSGTILNTTSSNSSMTFSVPIAVTMIDVESDNITLSNVTCSNNNKFISQVFWNTPNANQDSADYCSYNTNKNSNLSILSSVILLMVCISLVLLNYVYFRGFEGLGMNIKGMKLDEITDGKRLKQIITIFIIDMIGIAFIISIANTLVGSW